MKEAKEYREYAADCLRLAAKATAKDKEILMRMADAWRLRAEYAEGKNTDKKK
jgi:hypothetical protein